MATCRARCCSTTALLPQQVPDPMRDYFVDAFKIGRYIIKVQLSAQPRKRPPYYVTSFEKVPGTVVGNALPDILDDIQDATNAALRSPYQQHVDRERTSGGGQ